MGIIQSLFVDVTSLPQTHFGFIQLLFLCLIYLLLLCKSWSLMGGASGLLLLLPKYSGLVSNVVYPVLGVVPHGAIVLFSGLGDPTRADEQLSVGVGAMCGLTISLLTVPLGCAILSGRVDLENEKPAYWRKTGTRLTPGMPFAQTGVGVSRKVVNSGKWMLGTAAIFLVIQIPAFALHCSLVATANQCSSGTLQWFALVGLILCAIGFFGNLLAEIKSGTGKDHQKRVKELRRQVLQKGEMSLRALFKPVNVDVNNKAIKGVVRPFFQKYDRNRDGSMDYSELASLLRDLNEKPTPEALRAMMREMDQDENGYINFEEFVQVITRILQAPDTGAYFGDNTTHSNSFTNNSSSFCLKNEPLERRHSTYSCVATLEDEPDVPSDLEGLAPDLQQLKLKWRAAWLLILSGLGVLLFSDPLVEAVSEVGIRMGVPPFYISFILIPGAKTYAAFSWSDKKTHNTVAFSFRALYGSVTMNNTFCLAMVLALVYFRQLAWQFSSQITVMLLVEVIAFYMSTVSVINARWGAWMCALFPFSILLIALMQTVGFN